ncbi:uncharacterized protein LOC124925311 [Impatiens glandulifera]|uniref:uncharacterized protein LOC124925311 n=1 Tax=Impatiens glandulifera TaxID=253017 RepID=UPI001FB15A9A|nr:uncharacterized protein LOC124925311 [Impatiens glandulifera]
MGANFEEAARAKENAERRFAEKDYKGAKSYALKAQMLCPELDGIAQMVATFDVYIASDIKINGETDFYSILGLEPFSERSKVKKQYKKMAVLLHPDKNKTVGADGAFKHISEAWTLLSDNKKRTSYDMRRNQLLSSQLAQTVHNGVATGTHQRLDTFWTVCTSCQVQYEYLRKYLNKRLSCKNCRGVFVAVETGLAPISSTYPYNCSWTCDNGYGMSHGYNSVSYAPASNIYFSGNGSDYSSNVSFQRGSYPGASSGVAESTVMGSQPANQTNGNLKRTITSGSNGYSDLKAGKIHKKRKLDQMEGGTPPRNVEIVSNVSQEVGPVANGNGSTRYNYKTATTPIDIPSRPFDTRKFLLDKARTEIIKKLEEVKAYETIQKEKIKLEDTSKIPDDPPHIGVQLELKRTGLTAITVPDPDFHDFDKDRSEDCFKPKQIWAIYDEDGMPRLYCLIRQVISLRPFKINISYLSSKTDTEFGSVNWISSGFTKSCGSFRAWNAELVEQVNIFSHILGKEKAGRGGCVRIYPRRNSVWAIYKNWSPEWNRKTPMEVRRQYEMVEIMDDYSEDMGVCVVPLMKLDGFKTVYRRNSDKGFIRMIPKREMLCFSHQVPSWSLRVGEEGCGNLPDGCWDLDPAATPEELLHADNYENKMTATTETSDEKQ